MASASGLLGGLLSGVGEGMVSQAEARRQEGLERARAIRRELELKSERTWQESRDQKQQDFQTERDKAQNKLQIEKEKTDRKAQHENRLEEIAATGRESRKTASSRPDNAPAGYRWTADGRLQIIPGGPADPENPKNDRADLRNIQSLRKEFEGMDAVKNYKAVLPLYQRASTAPNTRAGDISVIYALGKMFDPTSVVREGELILSKNAAPWLQKVAAEANSQISGKGAIGPDTRRDILDALKGQVDSFALPYTQERERYSRYATEGGFEPAQIVGSDPSEAFKPPAENSPGKQNAPVKVSTPAEAMKLPSGTQFVTPDGRIKVRP